MKHTQSEALAEALIVERMKSCMDASPADMTSQCRLAVRGHVKYKCPHCNNLLMSVVPGGVGIPDDNSRQLKAGWCFSTEEHFPDLETILSSSQRSIPHEVLLRMGDCPHCGAGYALLDIKVATHAKHIAALERYPNEKTYRVTARQTGQQWPMVKEFKSRGYTHAHWFGMYKLLAPIDAGPDNLVILDVDVCEVLGAQQFAELQDLIKGVWPQITEQLPAYTLKAASPAS